MKYKRITTILLFSLFLPFFALADVNTTEITTLVLPSDGSTYTLNSGGKFDGLTINNSSFAFDMSPGSVVYIISTDRKNLSNTLNVSTGCELNQSYLSLHLGPDDSAQTVTVTPSGTCNSGGGGGDVSLGVGGGGGNSGGGVQTVVSTSVPIVVSVTQVAPTALSIQQQIAEIQAKIAALSGGASVGVPPAYGVFARDLAPGQKDDEVKRLQELFKQDKELYPEGLVTGFYGPATTKAIKRFQAKYGLPQVGRVGPMTRKKIEDVFGGKTPVSLTPVATPQTTTTKTTDEKIKLIQDQIKQIQDTINSLKK